jgi:hypothetical protein
MTRRDRDISINEKQVVKSKITSDRILLFALKLGMISSEHYDCVKAIGRSKQVDQLRKELSINNIDAFNSMLRKMLRRGLITIVQDQQTPRSGSTRPAVMPAENEKEVEEADEEAHHVEDDEEDEDDRDDEADSS